MRKISAACSIWLFAAWLAACGWSPAVPTASPAPTSTPTETPLPTSTFIPMAVLIAAEQPPTPADALAVQAVTGIVEARGALLQRANPGEGVLDQALSRRPVALIVVAAGLGAAITEAAGAHPEIRFVAVNEPGARPAANLLVVGGDYAREEEAAFMAGLLAGVVNRNNRVGWIGGGDAVPDLRYRNGFIHGVRVTCPICLVYSSALPAGGGEVDIAGTVDYLLGTYLDTVSAAPGAARDAALIRLAGAQARVVGTRDGFYSEVFGAGSVTGAEYVVGAPSYRPDLLLEDALPRFLAGETFTDPLWYSLESGGLVYAEFPNEWITVGKAAFLQELLDGIAAGRMSVGVNHDTGVEE